MPKVLLVDDDNDFVDVLHEILTDDNYEVISAREGEGALYLIHNESPDIVLLDLGLPDIDGMILVSKIRKISQIPIIVLSARLTQSDRVVPLLDGADDVIAKPFDIYDLLARIEVVLKRSKRLPVDDPNLDRPVGETCGPLTISNASGPRMNGKPFHLTPTEFKLLALLVQSQGEAVSREDLAGASLGYTDAGSAHLIDVHMGRLRARLREYAGAPVITTVRHFGFRILSAPEN